MAITVVHLAYENWLVNNGHDSGHLIEHAFGKQHVPIGKGDTRIIILRIGIPVNKKTACSCSLLYKIAAIP